MTLRHWIAECQFEGLEKFFLGTVQAEMESEALRMLEAHSDDLLPQRPAFLAVIPGQLAFIEEGEL